MSTPIWCELVCRECARTTEGTFTYDTIPRERMKKMAKKSGWHFKHHECFCSDFCLMKYEHNIS